jgi:hypothetical protein
MTEQNWYGDPSVEQPPGNDCPARGNPISTYLMWAYAYYQEDDPLTSDWTFDRLAKWLLEHWDTLPPHPHKHLITKDDLRAGTYLGPYPEIVKACVNQYRKGALSD